MQNMDQVNQAVEVADTSNGGPIARTNRFFMQIKSYGCCDAKGRTVMGIETSQKKMIAPPDMPLTWFSVLLEQVMPGMSWSSKEAMEKDLATLQDYVKGLRIVKD